MTYWLREIAGWLLVLLGLWVFVTVLDFCRARLIFEAGILTVVGVIVFRGGIHLLKTAVAARICLQANEQLAAPAPKPPLPRPVARPMLPARR